MPTRKGRSGRRHAGVSIAHPARPVTHGPQIACSPHNLPSSKFGDQVFCIQLLPPNFPHKMPQDCSQPSLDNNAGTTVSGALLLHIITNIHVGNAAAAAAFTVQGLQFLSKDWWSYPPNCKCLWMLLPFKLLPGEIFQKTMCPTKKVWLKCVKLLNGSKSRVERN